MVVNNAFEHVEAVEQTQVPPQAGSTGVGTVAAAIRPRTASALPEMSGYTRIDVGEIDAATAKLAAMQDGTGPLTMFLRVNGAPVYARGGNKASSCASALGTANWFALVCCTSAAGTANWFALVCCASAAGTANWFALVCCASAAGTASTFAPIFCDAPICHCP